jgi:fido (protein-threonine AMPylation protein)
LALQHAKRLAELTRPLTAADACELHRLLFERAWRDIAGQHREVEIDAFPNGDLPPHQSAVAGEMLLFGTQLEGSTGAAPRDAAEALDVAIRAHMELVRIHPFQEGNGKTARLLLNTVVMRYVTSPTRPLTFTLDDRDRHVRCVREARQDRAEGFAVLLADLLEQLVEEEEARGRAFVSPWRFLRRN